MKQVTILDKEFILSIPNAAIDKEISRMADAMNEDLRDKNPLIICILNGSFMFAGDIMKKFDFPCEISFVKFSSYQGTSTTGDVKELIGLNEDIAGREIVILEDIVDTGITIEKIITHLKKMKPSNIRVATLLYKPEACTKAIPLNYIGMEIPNEFIVGYGLDYNGYGRNLADIYTVVK